MQLEIGMSISRYLPATGTAGLARSLVSGYSRVPRPPPRIRLSTGRSLADISGRLGREGGERAIARMISHTGGGTATGKSATRGGDVSRGPAPPAAGGGRHARNGTTGG